MSIIASGTTTTNALVQTGNTDGTLQLQVNGTTPAVTLNTFGAVGVGSSPSYGTSGQVLTSGGSTAAPSWATLTVSGSGGTTATGSVTLTSASGGAQSITTTDYGQYVKLPSATTMTKAASVFTITNAGIYPLKVLDNAGSILGFISANQSTGVGLADNSTAAGVWNLSNVVPFAASAVLLNGFSSTIDWSGTIQVISLDANRNIIFGYQSGASIYAVVYDSSTNTWGTTVTVAANSNSTSAILASTDKVLVAYIPTSTTVGGVVLTISGTTITVNTPVTTAIGSTAAASDGKVIAVGSAFVFAFRNTTPEGRLIAMTVSGTVPTLGTIVATTSTSTNLALYSTSATSLFTVNATSNQAYIEAWTLSGTTLTMGTSRLKGWTSGSSAFRLLDLTGGKYALLYADGSVFMTVFTVSAGTISALGTAVSIGSTATNSNVNQLNQLVISSSKVLFQYGNSANTQAFVNIVSVSGTTCTAGTEVQMRGNPIITYASLTGFSGNTAYFLGSGSTSTTSVASYSIDVSGSSPVVLSGRTLTAGNVGQVAGTIAYTNVQNSIAYGMYGTPKNGAWIGTTNCITLSPVAAYSLKFSTTTGAVTLVPVTTDMYGNSPSVNGNQNDAWKGIGPSTVTGPALIRYEGAVS